MLIPMLSLRPQIRSGPWMLSSLRPEFIHRGKQYYDADISGLKGAPKTINAWVASRTHGKIKEIVEQVDPLTVLFLGQCYVLQR